MRPIEIAPIPKKPDGSDKSVTNYQDWRQDLIDAYGPHCAYCNCKMPNSAEVEHEVAKSLPSVDPLAWGNLVLACKPCNTAKTNHLFTETTHYIPTKHNTHIIFDYEVMSHPKLINHQACVPKPSSTFHPTSPEFEKALKTIKDLELNRIEQNPSRTRKATDLRWKNRYEVLQETKSARILWNCLINDYQRSEFLPDLINRVFNTGFFSLWYNAFDDEPKALKAIIDAFKGTAHSYFDPDNGYKPIHRNPTNASDPI